MPVAKSTIRPAQAVQVQNKGNPAHSVTTLVPTYRRPEHGIVAFLPASWVPYAELMRLDRLSGFWAFYCHYLIGLVYAANLCHLSAETRFPIEVGKASSSASFHVLSPFTPLGTSSQAACRALTSDPAESALTLVFYTAFFCVWTTVFRGITCAWNDNLDQEFDRKVARTQNRPIARGAVSTFQGHVFTIILIVVAAGILYPMPRSVKLHALVDGALLFVYPLLKRCTDFPQLELGFGLSYPVFMVTALVGQDPLAPLLEHGLNQTGFLALMKCSKLWSAACLYGAGILWTVIFDTIYAHQDYEDDCRAGVRGLAVRLGRKGTKPTLSVLASVQVMLLIMCGEYAGFGLIFRVVSCAGVAVSLARMLWMVELENGESCAWWFGPGSRRVGLLTIAGLFGEYVVRMYA